MAEMNQKTRGIHKQDLESLRAVFPSLVPLHGKMPFEGEWQKACEEVRPFSLSDFIGCNAGIAGGPANGVIILDVDHMQKFNKMLKERNWLLRETRTHLTGKGKPHYLYEYPKNGHRYGCTSIKDPEGEIDPETGKVLTVFDIKGVGGQVVGPGSIHPDTGKKYTIHNDSPIAPAPEWLLELVKQEKITKQAQEPVSPQTESLNTTLESLNLPYAVKKLILDGEVKGKRSEAIMSVLNSLVRAKADNKTIIQIFETNKIGEKYREVGNTREKWLLQQVGKARGGQEPAGAKKDIAARVKEYLFDEFDGGVFKLSDLRKELGLNDYDYALARNCVKRLVDAGKLQKHGQQLGSYRVVDAKKKAIDWEATEAGASKILLPGNLHEVATIRDGDLICFAGFKNQNKTALAIETIRLNQEKFQIHFFITEYAARMKNRLLSFGVDLKHPNLHCYPMEKSDYIPDKIERGRGVLNVIDHYPNSDLFYLVGKVQDEICNALNGAICVMTHQKRLPEDLDAVGGSFWLGAPTLAVTLFYNDGEEYRNRMVIRKGKEPGQDRSEATGLSLRYKLTGGCKFSYDPKGWGK
jgi:hypothetical protein